jgi:hypothetical protein
MNKSKKELVQEIDNLIRIIAFYIDEDILIEGQEKVLEKIKRKTKINNRLCKVIYILATILLCVSFYLLGLSK